MFLKKIYTISTSVMGTSSINPVPTMISGISSKSQTRISSTSCSFFCETHRDHYAANILLKNNLVRSATIAAYEVWTPLIPNRLVNISSVIDDKRNALLEHASQLKELDYLDAALQLNRYRAAMFRKEPRYAEAFIYCTSVQYFVTDDVCRMIDRSSSWIMCLEKFS